MIDTQGMAVFHSIEHLKKDVLDERVVAEIPAVVKNLRKEVVVGGEIHNNISVIEVFHDAMQSYYTGVDGGELVKGDFSDVDLALAGRLVTSCNQAFHGVRLGWIANIDCPIDDTVTANTKDLNEFQGVPINESPEGRMDGGRGRGRCLRSHCGRGRSKWKGMEAEGEGELAPVRTGDFESENER